MPNPPSGLPLEPKSDDLRRLIDLCADFVVEHIDSLASQPSFDLDGAERVASTFEEPIPEEGRPLSAILERVGRAVGKSFTTSGPGYLAFIPGGGIPSAAMADFVACAVNRFVGVAAAAPALARLEARTISWLATLMGYPSSASGILTSGGSLSNLIALVTARVDRLPESFQDGVLYVSEETHLSVLKAARFAGFPERCVRRVPVDRRFRLRPDRLREEIASDLTQGRRPFFVVANVGTTNTGAIDPIPEIVEIARRHGLWVHADAAYGGFFRLIPEGTALLKGIEDCDSITLDPHKGLFLPYGTGCLLTRDPETLRRAHQGAAGYLQDVGVGQGTPSFTDLSPELSRDFRGLRLWLPIQLHGLRAFREQIQEKLDLARMAHAELRDDPLFQMLDTPQLSIVAFTAGPAAGGDSNRFGAELLRRVNARRRVFLSSTTIGGRYVLRICVLSFRTHADRVRDAVLALKEEARALAGGGTA